MLTFENDVLISRYEELANSIVLQAVNDWRAKCKRLYTVDDLRRVSFHELRKFFNSEWCSALAGDGFGKKALKILEQERADIIEYIKSGQEPVRKTVKEELQWQLRKRGLSQDKLAKLAGVTQGHIAGIINSRKRPSLELLERLESALGLPDGHLTNLGVTE